MPNTLPVTAFQAIIHKIHIVNIEIKHRNLNLMSDIVKLSPVCFEGHIIIIFHNGSS